MPTRVQHKRSSVAANVPASGDLDIGEIAINFSDRYIYTKNGASAVIRLTGHVPLVQPAANQVAGDSYIDPTTGKLYVYFSLNGNPIAWNEIAPEQDVSGYLPLIGGIMTGQIILPGGAVDDEAVSYNQVNSLLVSTLADYIKKNGSVAMTGDLTLANNTPSNDLHAASKKYVDDAVVIATPDLSAFLPKSGGIMTGQITLPGGGTGNQAASANEVASAVAAHVAAPDPHTQYATIAESQIGVFGQATGVGGTADAIELSFTPALDTLTTYMLVRWTASGANTVTNPTLKIGGATAKTIKKDTNAALNAKDISGAGMICYAVYNGTDFILLNPQTEFDTLMFAAADEISNITTGTDKMTIHCPFACTLLDFFAGLTVVQASGSVLTVDIKKNGTTIFSTLITFDNNEATTLTAATPAVLSSSPTTFAKGDKITVDVTQVGTAGAKGLKIYMNVARYV